MGKTSEIPKLALLRKDAVVIHNWRPLIKVVVSEDEDEGLSFEQQGSSIKKPKKEVVTTSPVSDEDEEKES